MPTEILPQQTRLPSPEMPKGGPEMVGLRARLIARDQNLLNPSFKMAESMGIVSFGDRQYSPFERASRNDRKKAYNPATSFDDQYKEWENGVTTTFTSEAHAEKITQLGSLLHTMGVDINGDQPFTKDHAKKLYDTYFDTDGGVKKFVGDVLKTYAPQQDRGYATINNQIENITWLANLFGDEGKEMVRELILSEIALQSNPEYFQGAMASVKDKDGNEVARINNLNEKEEKILSFITGNQQEDTKEKEEEEGEQKGPDTPLPIFKRKQEIIDALSTNDTVIIIGATGSGKTIGTPQIVRELLKPGERLLITEPTQLNTGKLATDIAHMQGLTPGEEIAYQHGGGGNFDDRNPKTDTVFMTEGLVLRKIAQDPLLQKWDYIMMDEVHVRSKNSELLMEILKQIQQKRREANLKPLKLIFASATVDQEKLEEYLPGSKTVEVEGRTHPITKHYPEKYFNEMLGRPLDEKKLPQEAGNVAAKIAEGDKQGDILVFVAGVSDIKRAVEEIQKKNLDNVEIFALHSGSPEEVKKEVEKKADQLKKGVRRIIVSTNFAETGVTIHNLKFVVNTGEEFIREVDAKTGLEYMKKNKQSRAGIDQRSGRVGRVSPGDVYNLFSETDYDSRPKYPIAELERTDLTDLVLELKNNKVRDILGLNLLSKLDSNRVAFAEETLRRLDALNPDGSLNAIGKEMYNLPIDYHLARMIIEAKNEKKGVIDAVKIAALIQTRNILPSTDPEQKALMARYRNPNSDFLTLLNLWKDFEANGKTKEWAENNELSYETLMSVEAMQVDLLKRLRVTTSTAATDDELGKFIYHGYKDRLMRYNGTGVRPSYVWTRDEACNINFHINSNSALSPSTPEYIIAASNDAVTPTTRNLKLSNCQVVDPSWI